VHSLINDFAATRSRRICAPLPFVAESTSVAVASPEVEDLPVVTRTRFSDGASDAEVEPVIEADLYEPADPLRDLEQLVYLSDADPGGFLDEDMGPRLEGAATQVSELIVCHSHDNDVRLQLEEMLERRIGDSSKVCGQPLRSIGDQIEASHELVLSERFGSFPTDQATSHDPNAKGRALRHEYSKA
jgi:hypothetical protein